ncbi:MAG TPA: ATP-binding protein [Caulobacteraceae bacterium]|nr:ATP-binding protein [Caulobacteraceae bacterium]
MAAHEQQAIDRITRWRVDGFWVRLGQAVVVAVFAYLATHASVTLVWLAAAAGTGVLDVLAFRHFRRRRDDPGALAIALCALALSTATFSSIGFVLLTHPSVAALAGALLILCATNLNTAVMTRGWPAVSRVALASSSLLILTTPVCASVAGYGLSLTDGLVLEAGALTYVTFIALLLATLHRESVVLQHSLESQGRQRDYVRLAKEEAERARARWSMLFDQSPLPQVCFDASRLHAILGEDAGRPGMGEVLRGRVSAVAQAFDYIALTEANAATEALFGVARIEGRMDFNQFDRSFLTGFCDSLDAIDEDGVFPPFEARVFRANGEAVEVAVHVRTLPGGERPWSTCIATFVDITAMRRAARAQEEATRAAEAANRAKSEFLAIMSHEIRTPLNGVLGMVQAMSREALPDAQRERLEVIGTSGETLLAILNDILDLSKIEAGRLELEDAPFDLAGLARAVHASFADVAGRKGLAFGLDVEAAAHGVWRGDQVRVRQLLTNLISNAVKFTETGSVQVDLGRGDGGVRLRVSDTGLGIAPERIEHLFDKFVQADSSTTRRFGGTGLGLAICQELCRAMGGTIRVASEVGAGSVFTVDLPLTQVSTADAAGEPQRAGADAAGRPTLRILAAEDNAVNQLVLRTLLGQAGLEPVIVGNGEEALAAWESEPWDVILMDVQMPVMDGPTATRAIRAREAEAGRAPTPIIALTANAMTHQTAGYRAAGMTGFVAKPIEVSQLFAALESAFPPPGGEGQAAPAARVGEKGTAAR